jgi:hypothetical protein
MATVSDSIKAPASTVAKPDRIRNRTVKGQKVTECQCRFCSTWMPVDKANWYPYRAIDGAFHLNSRCVACDRAYRVALKRQVEAGNHVPIARPKHRDEAEAEPATDAPKPKRQRKAKVEKVEATA